VRWAVGALRRELCEAGGQQGGGLGQPGGLRWPSRFRGGGPEVVEEEGAVEEEAVEVEA